MTYQILQQVTETRCSTCTLNRNLLISDEEVNGTVRHAVLHAPSSFNSQSTRIVIFLSEEHGKVW